MSALTKRLARLEEELGRHTGSENYTVFFVHNDEDEKRIPDDENLIVVRFVEPGQVTA